MSDGASFITRYSISRHKELAWMQEVDTDNSVSLGTRPGRAVVHRHALFNDFSITEPFGIVNAAAGIISLFFKVQSYSVCMSAVMVCYVRVHFS